MWLQKSRLNWSLNGDKNTRFFYLTAKGRQNSNLLNSISVEGETFDDPTKVKMEVFNHFQEKFSKN